MAVLHIIPWGSADLDLRDSPLERSLRRQRDTGWRLASRAAPLEGLGNDDFVIHVDADATLRRDAVQLLCAALNDDRAAVAVYADVHIGERTMRRPGWSRTRVISEPAACHPLAVRASEIDHDALADPARTALELARRGHRVLHIPAPLSTHTSRTAHAEPAATLAAVLSHVRSIGLRADVDPGPRPGTHRLRPRFDQRPTLSVVIPTAGTPHRTEAGRFVDHCLRALARTDWTDLKVLVVVGDEFAGDPHTLTFPAGLSGEVIGREPGPFNFSNAINSGVLAASGELILLLNDDTEPIEPGWLDRMAVHLDDPSVGAVGAALQYPDGSVQHAGLVIDDARPLHPFVRWRPEATAPHGGDLARDVIAVTGACLLARRRDFLAVGGFSTRFPLSFNDVDFCLRLQRCGFRVVIEPGARLVHHESASREPHIEPWEWDRYIHRWGEVTDPWYHPGHHRPDDPLQLRRNADHLDPDEPVESTTARDTEIRPRVHHTRTVLGSPADRS